MEPRSHLNILRPGPAPRSLPASSVPSPLSDKKPKLLDLMRDALRTRHYSRRTEQMYAMWVKRYCRFHGLRHPVEMAEKEVNGFLSHLALDEHVSASTQNQALCALLFLYRHVLNKEIGEIGEVIRARKPRRLPVVLSQDKVRAALKYLEQEPWLMVSLLYGSGL